MALRTLLITALAVACRDGGGGEGDRGAGLGPPPDTLPPSAMSPTGADSLEISLTLPAMARLGEPVPMEVTVTNRANRRLTLLLRGREIVIDIEVRDSRELVVWRKLEEAIIPAILRVEELAPGQTITLRDGWPQRDQAGNPVPAGEYQVQGSVLTEGEPLRTPRRRIRIE